MIDPACTRPGHAPNCVSWTPATRPGWEIHQARTNGVQTTSLYHDGALIGDDYSGILPAHLAIIAAVDGEAPAKQEPALSDEQVDEALRAVPDLYFDATIEEYGPESWRKAYRAGHADAQREAARVHATDSRRAGWSWRSLVEDWSDADMNQWTLADLDRLLSRVRGHIIERAQRARSGSK